MTESLKIITLISTFVNPKLKNKHKGEHKRTMNFGERVRKLRQNRKMSLQDLGTECGVSRQKIWTYEMGLSTPSAATLTLLAKTLCVTTDYLLCLTDKQ